MKIKTELNGQPFEIEVDDSLTLELSDGKLIVRPANVAAPVYIPFVQPQYSPYQPIGTITCTSGMNDGGTSYTLYH